MRTFDEIFDIAAGRKGGDAALDALLERPRPRDDLAAVPADRWLSAMARSLFEAGFNWKLIETKWPVFEEAFGGFEVGSLAFGRDEDLDRLLADSRIVRNGAKVAAVLANARFLSDLAAERGPVGAVFADWPDSDYAGLLDLLARRGAHLGGLTGQRALRRVGRSGYVLSPDVVARLVAEGVVAKAPTARRDIAAVQAAFDLWQAQSGRSLTEISRVLAYSV